MNTHTQQIETPNLSRILALLTEFRNENKKVSTAPVLVYAKNDEEIALKIMRDIASCLNARNADVELIQSKLGIHAVISYKDHIVHVINEQTMDDVIDELNQFHLKILYQEEELLIRPNVTLVPDYVYDPLSHHTLSRLKARLKK